MSLVTELNKSDSPISRFLAAELPDVKDVVRGFHRRLPAAGDVLLPKAPAGVKVAWSTLGMAIDHRLRYALAAVETPSLAVGFGMMFAGSEVDNPAADAIMQAAIDLKAALKQVVVEATPSDRSRPMALSAATEERFARICYAMSWFEEVTRSGRLWPGTPLGDADEDFTLDAMLAAVPEYAVVDLAAQVRLADRGLAEVRASVEPTAVRIGPVFAGSTDVGGADADMTLGDLLLDVKATIGGRKRLGKADLWQLVGYALLDYEDEYSIRRVGFYLTRSGQLVCWNLAAFLALFGCFTPLAEMRERCASALTAER